VDARIAATTRRRLPLRLIRLLEDFARIGVLRETGATHQFRHDALLTRLAEHGSAPPGAAAGPAAEPEWRGTVAE